MVSYHIVYCQTTLGIAIHKVTTIGILALCWWLIRFYKLIRARAFSSKKEILVSTQINLCDIETKDIATAIDKLPRAGKRR